MNAYLRLSVLCDTYGYFLINVISACVEPPFAIIPVTVQDTGTDIFVIVLRPFLVQFPGDPRVFHAGLVKTSQLDGKAVPFREKALQFFNPPDMVLCL